MEPQAVWAVIAGVLILALGVFLFCRPETFWRLTEQWKSYRADEPSGLYRISTKFGGGFHCPFAFSPAVAPILLYAQDRN